MLSNGDRLSDGRELLTTRRWQKPLPGGRILALLLAVAVLGLVACGGGEQAEVQEPPPSSPAPEASAWNPGAYIVGTYYYPWYSAETHWRDGYLFTPLLGEYDSRDPGIITTHLAWAQYYGIDFLAVSWWGPGSFEDTVLRDAILTNPAASNLRFAILYEPVGPGPGRLAVSEDGSIDLTDPANHDLLISDFRYMAETYFANPLYLRLDGRPVVFLFGSRDFRGKADGLAGLRAVVGEVGESLYLIGDEVTCSGKDAPDADLSGLDAVTIYSLYGWCGTEEKSVRENPEAYFERVEEAYGAWRWWATSLGLTFVPHVFPGYNDAAVRPEAANPPIPRYPARFDSFAQMARELVDPELPVVLITSFNQWSESTQVEPSREEGFGYLDVIRADFQ